MNDTTNRKTPKQLGLDDGREMAKYINESFSPAVALNVIQGLAMRGEAQAAAYVDTVGIDSVCARFHVDPADMFARREALAGYANGFSIAMDDAAQELIDRAAINGTMSQEQ